MKYYSIQHYDRVHRKTVSKPVRRTFDTVDVIGGLAVIITLVVCLAIVGSLEIK